MKTKEYYFILSVIAGVLWVCSLCSGQSTLADESGTGLTGLIGRANPALAGIEKLYVIVEPSDAKPSRDGLVWKELQAKVEHKLKEAAIEIAPGVSLGRGVRARDIPELIVYIELLKFADSQLYVFRVQLSLAAKAYLREQKLFFKADVWKADTAMEAVSAQNMPAKVTNVVLEQVEAFIHAYLAANPPAAMLPDTNEVGNVTAPKEQARPVTKPAVAEYEYVASKNSKVFHRPDCSSAKRISPENLVSYSSRDEAIKTGRRPCKRCKP